MSALDPRPVGVTGAAGFIGRAVVGELLARGERVVAIDSMTEIVYPSAGRRARLAHLLGHPNLSYLEADISDPAARRALASCARVINLAGLSGQRQSWEHPEEYHRVNAVAAAELFESCTASGVEVVVHASTSSVYGPVVEGDEEQPIRPCSPYGESKAAGEVLLRSAALGSSTRLVIARLFSVYGPGQRSDMGIHGFVEAALAGGPLLVHDHDQIGRDFTYVDDVAGAMLAMLDPSFPEGSYNVASGRRVPLARVFEIIESALAVPLDRRLVPMPAGLQISTHASIAKLLAASDWAPKVTIEDGIMRQIADQRSLA